MYCLEDETCSPAATTASCAGRRTISLRCTRFASSAMSADAAPINSITTDVKSKVLVGTKIGEIWEISDEARLVVEAHGKGELWGIALHPSDEHKMATCSDDGTACGTSPPKGRSMHARAWPRKEDSKPIRGSASSTPAACDPSRGIPQ